MRVAIVVLLSGCSLFVRAVPDPVPARGTPVDCTTSRALPIVDTVAAVSALIVTAYELSRAAEGEPEHYELIGFGPGAVAIPAGLLGALYGFMAAQGFIETGRCREIIGDRAAPPAVAPPLLLPNY